MNYRKKNKHLKIGPKKNQYDSLFSREVSYQNILGKDVEVKQEDLSLVEFFERMIASGHGGTTDALYTNIERCEENAREVLKKAGLPIDCGPHPLPDNPGHLVKITDHRLVGINPTAEYHAAQVIELANELKRYLKIDRDVEKIDLICVADLSSRMTYCADCLILHDWEYCARVGEKVIKANMKNYGQDKIEWEQIAFDLYHDPIFMADRNPRRVMTALAEAVAKKVGGKMETIRSYFKKEKIPQKFDK